MPSSAAPFCSYARVKCVASFEELIATRFSDGVNALCWPRALTGDFDEIARALGPVDEITTLDEEDLADLALSPAGQAARRVLIEDQRLLAAAGLSPSLDFVPPYVRPANTGPVPTDVGSYHVDSATVEADTYLCSYNLACTEGLPNEQALRRVDVPETRAALLARYGGDDDEGFAAYCSERFFDLHYVPAPGAQPYAFGFGNLWRIATLCPHSPVPPCIHRAPTTFLGQLPRLLLIS